MVLVPNVQLVLLITELPKPVSPFARSTKHLMEQHVYVLLDSTESTDHAVNAQLEPLTIESISLVIQVAKPMRY